MSTRFERLLAALAGARSRLLRASACRCSVLTADEQRGCSLPTRIRNQHVQRASLWRRTEAAQALEAEWPQGRLGVSITCLSCSGIVPLMAVWSHTRITRL